MHFNKLTDDERKLVKEQIANYHKYYDLISDGDYYRLIDPTERKGSIYHDAAWMTVSADKMEALVTYVVVHTQPTVQRYLRLTGLNPTRIYVDEASGHCYSGALLMNAGLNVSKNYVDGESRVWHFVAE